VFFVEIDCTGTAIFPGGQSEHRKEVQFRIASATAWDPTNDYSFQDLRNLAGGQTVKTARIVLFDAGTRVFGQEPAGGQMPPPGGLAELLRLVALLQQLADLFAALFGGGA